MRLMSIYRKTAIITRHLFGSSVVPRGVARGRHPEIWQATPDATLLTRGVQESLASFNFSYWKRKYDSTVLSWCVFSDPSSLGESGTCLVLPRSSRSSAEGWGCACTAHTFTWTAEQSMFAPMKWLHWVRCTKSGFSKNILSNICQQRSFCTKPSAPAVICKCSCALFGLFVPAKITPYRAVWKYRLAGFVGGVVGDALNWPEEKSSAQVCFDAPCLFLWSRGYCLRNVTWTSFFISSTLFVFWPASRLWSLV